MEEKNIAEKFACLFKLESGDMQWYESIGFEDWQDLYTPELLKEAKDRAMKVINDPQEHLDAVENDAFIFMDGACWYIKNYHILEKLSKDEYENAIIIANIIYAKETCKNAYEDVSDEWTRNEAFNYISSVEETFLYGVEWAEKKKRNV